MMRSSAMTSSSDNRLSNSLPIAVQLAGTRLPAYRAGASALTTYSPSESQPGMLSERQCDDALRLMWSLESLSDLDELFDSLVV